MMEGVSSEVHDYIDLCWSDLVDNQIVSIFIHCYISISTKMTQSGPIFRCTNKMEINPIAFTDWLS